MAYTPFLHMYLPAEGEQGYGPALNENFNTLDEKIQQLSQATNPNAYVPTGCQIIGCSTTPPAGWLLCDGSEVLRSTYPELFAAIGTTYGTPSSSSKFRLPNKVGRVVVGADPTGADPDYALGKTGGEESVALTLEQMPEHDHGGGTGSGGGHGHAATTAEAGKHTHTLHASVQTNNWCQGGGNTCGAGDPLITTSEAPAHTHQITVPEAPAHTHTISSVGGGAAHENRMPYIAEYWWIKT